MFRLWDHSTTGFHHCRNPKSKVNLIIHEYYWFCPRSKELWIASISIDSIFSGRTLSLNEGKLQSTEVIYNKPNFVKPDEGVDQVENIEEASKDVPPTPATAPATEKSSLNHLPPTADSVQVQLGEVKNYLVADFHQDNSKISHHMLVSIFIS